MKFKKYSFIFSCVLALLASCTDEENKKPEPQDTPPPVVVEEKKEAPKPSGKKSDEYTEEKINLGLTPNDKKQLMLHRVYPMGTPFKKIHDEMNLKGIKPSRGSDELATQGMTESDTKVTIMGQPADLKLSFKNDSLYAYSYLVVENDFNKASRLYKGLQQFYSEEMGPCKELTSEEETLTTRSCNWNSKHSFGTITYDVNAGIINWGFQKRD